MKVGTLLKVGSVWDIACPKLVTNFKKYRGSFSVFEYLFGEYVRPGQRGSAQVEWDAQMASLQGVNGHDIKRAISCEPKVHPFFFVSPFL